MNKLNSKPFWILVFFVLIPVFVPMEINAQADSTFIPNGKPFALIYSDVHYTSNHEGSSKAFEITRAYLGYEYSFSKTIFARINIDVGDPGTGDFQKTAFLKNAFVQYKNGNFSARIGMINTDQFSIQEKQWGYRYIYMSYQDAYKFGPSADLGAALEYSPAKLVSFDFSVLNGEGFKNVQLDSIFKATLGITLSPFTGFFLRGYCDVMKDNYARTSFAVMAGYTLKKFRSGIEYNLLKNNGMISGNDMSGISVYASLGLAERFSIFSRYDLLESTVPPDTTNPSGVAASNGQLFIAGFDYTPVKGVKISPTYFGYVPEDKKMYFTSRFGLFFEVKF